MLQNSCQICNIMVFDTYFFENQHKLSLEPQTRLLVVFLSVLCDCDNKTVL